MHSIGTNPDATGFRVSGPSVFVFGVWLVMVAGALNFLSRFSVNVPYAEDGMLIPYVTGNEPFSWDFFWCQYSNHVIPLPKLVLIFLTRLTHDFRTSMYVSVLACAVVALILTGAAIRLRGRLSYSDAFFSLGLLHLGHWESFLLGFAIQEVMACLLLSLILLTILRIKSSLSHAQFCSLSSCLLLLPLTGGSGFLISPVLIGWLAYSIWIDRRLGRFASNTAFIFRVVLLIAASTTLLPYLLEPSQGVSWQGTPSRVDKISIICSVFFQILTLGFGSSASTNWMPFLGGSRACYLVGSSIMGLAVLGLFQFLRRDCSEDRLRKTGLIFFLLANLLVVAAISYGRGAASATIGMSPRYSLYSVPILWGLYFSWELYGTPIGRQLVPVGLFAFMCAMTSLNMNIGLACGQSRQVGMKAIERDILRSEVPAIDIASTHGRFVSSGHWVYYKLRKIGGEEHARFAEMVHMLREANIPRQKIAPSPP